MPKMAYSLPYLAVSSTLDFLLDCEVTGEAGSQSRQS